MFDQGKPTEETVDQAKKKLVTIWNALPRRTQQLLMEEYAFIRGLLDDLWSKVPDQEYQPEEPATELPAMESPKDGNRPRGRKA